MVLLDCSISYFVFCAFLTSVPLSTTTNYIVQDLTPLAFVSPDSIALVFISGLF